MTKELKTFESRAKKLPASVSAGREKGAKSFRDKWREHGRKYQGQCEVSGLSGIVAVAAGCAHTLGLKSDGKVVGVGDNEYGQCDVGDWHGIQLPGK